MRRSSSQVAEATCRRTEVATACGTRSGFGGFSSDRTFQVKRLLRALLGGDQGEGLECVDHGARDGRHSRRQETNDRRAVVETADHVVQEEGQRILAIECLACLARVALRGQPTGYGVPRARNCSMTLSVSVM
jgi:hypothetical protein